MGNVSYGALKLRKRIRGENRHCDLNHVQLGFQFGLREKRWTFDQVIRPDMRKEKRFPAGIADYAVFVSAAIPCEKSTENHQTRTGRKLQPDCGRNSDAGPSVRPGPSPTIIVSGEPNFCITASRSRKRERNFFDRFRPLEREIGSLLSRPRQTAARRGKFQRKNFHVPRKVMVRWFSDFISNRIQRACSGVFNSGKRSAHSITETPSPKK